MVVLVLTLVIENNNVSWKLTIEAVLKSRHMDNITYILSQLSSISYKSSIREFGLW